MNDVCEMLLDPLESEVFHDRALGSLATAGILGDSPHKTKIKACLIKPVG